MTHDLSLLSCRFIAPIEGVGLIMWWMVDTIRTDPDWWLFSTESLAMIVSQVMTTSRLIVVPAHNIMMVQWAGVLLVVIGLNWWLAPLTVSPPHHPLLRRSVAAIYTCTCTLYT